MPFSKYNHFIVKIENKVAQVSINRPEKANALHQEAWNEMEAIFNQLDETPEARVIILSGEGKHFCSGIDLELLMNIQQFQQIECQARMREKFRAFLQGLQRSVSSIEKCRKPVIAAIDNACIGAGVDIVTACDMRYCTTDTYFSVREVDMGLVADLGTMQRLPKIIPYGIAAEMAFSGRNLKGDEAKSIHLVNEVYVDREELKTITLEIAGTIAAKSPVVTRGIKQVLLHARDHSVKEGLDYVGVWNAGMIFSNDILEAFQASVEKRSPNFED